jgi:uncharacterized protein (DUF2235 family)
MKRIVLCFDGTWNALSNPEELTNIVRLANLVTVKSGEVDQISYYNSGVGSGGPIDRFLGGAFGVGLKSNVKRGLMFLALNYEAGDELYLFGFSRGAYTARALAGVIGTAGIPIDIGKTEVHWNLYQQIAKLRPKAGLPKDSPKRQAAEKAIAVLKEQLVPLSRNTNDAGTKMVPVPITCVGVWDTVGAYGIPSGIGGLTAISRMFTYWTRGFRDTHFGDTVKLGLHAVAVDERRRPFTPTFWTTPPKPPADPTAAEAADGSAKPPPVEQAWFAGVHSNVGGGYSNTGLSDLALAWMMAQVEEKTPLRFNEEEAMKTVWPCSACMLYRTSSGGWLNPVRSILPDLPREAGVWGFISRLLGRRRSRSTRINEQVHWSVRERQQWTATLVEKVGTAKYAPPNLRSSIKDFSKALPLELKLLDRTMRSWDNHCPLEKAKLPCQCAKRDLQALKDASPPSAALTPTPGTQFAGVVSQPVP